MNAIPQLLTNKQAATVEMLRKRVDPQALRIERYRMEESWIKNMAYFSGQHYFYIEDGRIVDATADIPEHRVMYKVNLTRMAVVRAAAKILNVNPKFRCAPQSGSARHRNIAETSDKLFEHLRNVTGWNDQISLVGTMWAEICGSAFYKTYYDAFQGEPDRFYMDSLDKKRVVPTALLDEGGMREKERAGLFEDIAKGEVAIDVQSPFAIYHDWTSRDKSIKGCQWMAERHFLDIDRVAERWNVDPKDLQSEDTNTGLANYEEAIAFMSSSLGFSPFNALTPDDKRGKRCSYIEMWERPSREHRKGRRVVYAGRRLLHDGDNPYIGDRTGYAHLPYVKQDWAPHPGRFWGCSLVEDLTSPQHAVNDARGCLLEFLRVFGRPATYIWSNSGIDPKEVTIEPGGVYTISAMSKPPAFAPTPALPPDITNIGQLCQSDLNMIASQSEIDGSKMPAALRSGEALRQLTEERDIALSVSAKAAIIATRDVGRIALSLAQLFYDEARTLRYIDSNSEWAFTDFTGADLTNDLWIVGEPSLMDSVASKRAELLDDIQAGVFDPANPDDKALILSALHYNTSDQAVKSRLKAQQHAEDSIRDMIADPLRYGEVGYPVFPWQDHEREMAVLVDFMYTPEFGQLKPFVQSVIAMYWQRHFEFFQVQLQQQAEMLQAQKGAPGEKGQPSKPKNGQPA